MAGASGCERPDSQPTWRQPGQSVVPGEAWAELPRSFRRLLLRDALLTEPSPAVAMPEVPTFGAAAALQAAGVGTVAGSVPGEPRRSSSLQLASLLASHVAAGHGSTERLRSMSHMDLPLGARSEGPRRAAGSDFPRATAPASGVASRATGLCRPLVVAYTRWRDVMEYLTITATPDAAAMRVDRLRRKTCNGLLVPAPESLGELFPELAELMRDGAAGLLAQPVLPQIYASLTTAFAGLCSMQLDLPACDDEAPAARYGLTEACYSFSEARSQAYEKAAEAMRFAERTGDHAATERACNEAIALDPTKAQPFLVRAGARLQMGERLSCLDDLYIYLWWSAREGFSPQRHVTAYWRMAETFLAELERKARTGGALVDDSLFHCLIDHAECSLGLACQHDPDGSLAQSDATKNLVQRIEGHRASRRAAAELLDSPVVPDANASVRAEQQGAEPSPRDYAVPWPVDLCAGLPDTALFSRMPAVGSSQEQDPLELLMLDFQGVLDLLATLQALATRSTAFAQRNSECLHWKYRPKQVHVHIQAASAQRLAHALLCFMIAKQVGVVMAADAYGTPSSPSFIMEETAHDRFLCTLLTAVLFCRTLTAAQRAEVDRLLTLLVFAATDEDYLHRAFPWLHLDDGRKADRSPKGARTRSSAASDGAKARRSGSWRADAREHCVVLGGAAWGTPLLLFRLQNVWLGWLSTSGADPAAALRGAPGGADRPTARLDQELAHRTARQLLLGRAAAAFCPALDITMVAAAGGATSGLSQRKLWALLGHFPAGTPAAGGASDERATEEDDPVQRSRPPDPRLRWRPFLIELAALRPETCCLNPCVLDPVSWEYDAHSVADPFRAFSWLLRSHSGNADEPWFMNPAALLEVADPPLPGPGNGNPPAVETLWELIMRQLKALSTVFNAFEAADAAHARAMVSAVCKGEETAKRPRATPVVSPSKEPDPRRVPPHVRVRGTEELRRRVTEQDDILKDEVLLGDVEKELDDLKKHRHEVSLDLELKDYVTLAAVRKKEKDWWGQDGLNTALYREAVAEGDSATWNPAPAACTPLRLRLTMFAGTPWRAAQAASYRGITFDAIDARTLLCTEVGLLGICTWFDALLKSTPHAYMQTRHCEEVFLNHVQTVSSRGSTIAIQAKVTAGFVQPRVSAPSQWPISKAPARDAARLIAPGAKWPPANDDACSEQHPRKAVLTQSGVMRWSSASPRPAHPPPSRLQTPRQRPISVLPLPPATKPSCGRWPNKPAVQEGGGGVGLVEGSSCLQCGSLFLPDARFCRKCGAKRPLDETASALLGRLLPPMAPPASRVVGAAAAAAQLCLQSDSRAAALSPSPAQPYTAESAIFAGLLQESISTHVGAALMQYLLGVAVRAEPLGAEVVLAYLGAKGLPVRRDFLFWDSSLESGHLLDENWPCNAQQFAGGALAGTLAVPQRETGTVFPKRNADQLAVFGKYWQQPGHQEKAAALGPRLLRIRRLGGHPALALAVGPKRCANAAFCARPILPPELPGATGGNDPVPCHCTECSCAWYCSASCQATHHAAHEFECQSLKALRGAVSEFESNTLETNKKILTTLLENILAKQFSMVPHAAALFGGTVLDEDLRRSITGAPAVPLPGFSGAADLEDPELQALRSEGFEDEGPAHRRWGARGKPTPQPAFFSTSMNVSEANRGRAPPHLLDSAQMVILPEEHARWDVELEAALLEVPQRTRRLQGRGDGAARSGAKVTAMFDVRLSHAHTAAGVIRLLSRWVAASQRAPALRAVIDEGFIFCLITGLCHTRQFCNRQLTEHAILSVLAHRMSLHVAASQEWRSLAPSLVPPKHFQDQGMHGIECAQYSAYYAFLQPVRLPFARLRLLSPIVCIAWGEPARRALLALPRRSQAALGARGGALEHKGSRDGDLPSSASRASPCTSSSQVPAGGELVSFLEVATEHVADLQLVDAVHLDVATGRAAFPLYTSVVEGRRGEGGLEEPWVLLLDAARGMQAVACPLPVRELRRCAL